jgi:hypothetical protein
MSGRSLRRIALAGQPIWWIHPGGLTLAFVLPLYIFVALLVPTLWPTLLVLRTRNYLTPELATLGATTIFTIGVSAWVGARIDLGSQVLEPRREVNEKALFGVGLVVLLAYAVWFGPILIHGQMLGRDDLNRIPGITSFTQLGVPFSLAYVYAALRNGQVFTRKTNLLFFAVMGLTLFRVYAWMERLAMIELVVPLGTLILCFARPKGRIGKAAQSLLAQLGPAIGLALLWVFFAATEVVRSWTTYSQQLSISLSEFVTSRIATYYFTALNNGAGMLTTARWPTYDLLQVLDWVYKLPGIGSLARDALGIREAPSGRFLSRFADVEFNNMSGIYPIFFDIGVPLGLLYFSITGAVTGALYRSLLKGQAMGALLFPPCLVACLEVMRIGYLNSSRVVLIFAGGLALLSQFRPVQKPEVAGRNTVSPDAGTSRE